MTAVGAAAPRNPRYRPRNPRCRPHVLDSFPPFAGVAAAAGAAVLKAAVVADAAAHPAPSSHWPVVAGWKHELAADLSGDEAVSVVVLGHGQVLGWPMRPLSEPDPQTPALCPCRMNEQRP